MVDVFHAVLRVLLLAVLVHAIPGYASSDDGNHVLTQEVFLDTSGNLDVADVVNAVFTPVDGIFAGGYSSDVVWMRVVVRPATDGGPLVLRILPTFLNHLTLYQPDAQRLGAWQTQASGNAIPWRERPYSAVALGFNIQPVTPTTYYLRLDTASSAMMSVEALTVKDAAHSEIYAMLWQGLFLSIIVWIVVWAVQDFVLHRDRLSMSFAAAHTVFLVYVSTITGNLSPLLSSTHLMPHITAWLVALLVVATAFFHRQLLLQFEHGRAARWALDALLGASVVATVLLALGFMPQAIVLANSVAALAGPTLLSVALTMRGDALPGLKATRIFYGLFTLTLTIYFLPTIGWTSGSVLTLYGAIFQGLASTILIGGLMYWRSHRLRQQGAQAQLMLHLSQRQVEDQKVRLEEQARFTAMLTHELKTPLASIRLSVDTLPRPHGDSLVDKRHQRIDRALADIDALVSRCVLTDRIDQRQVPLAVHPVLLSQIVTQVLERHPEAQRVHLTVEPALAPVGGDEQLLGVAIGNLIDNALKYAPAASPVEVNIRTVAGPDQRAGAQVDVINLPGTAGLPDPKRVYDKYHRGAAVNGKPGMGLGLYLVQAISQQHSGTIRQTLTDGRIVFSLWIPQAAH